MALGFLILIVRACFYASSDENTPPISDTSTPTPAPSYIPDIEITLYYHDVDEMRDMPLETYIEGVVAAEMPASFHDEALAAQAVAARTFTLDRIDGGGCPSSSADICSDSSCCQAYDDEEKCEEKWGDNRIINATKIENAVNKTRGIALYYEGDYIEALYHSSSGGYTENSENVFASARPYLRSVESSNEIGSDYVTDTVTMGVDEFVCILNDQADADISTDDLEDEIDIVSRYDSGQVEEVRIGDATLSGRSLRSLLELRSANFAISVSDDKVTIDTKGFGHGVGMSQTGANGMAHDGASFDEILAHYYTGATLK